MAINPIGKSIAAQEYGRISDRKQEKEASSEKAKASDDSVEISPEATLVAKARNAESSDRNSRIAEIKREIGEDRYVSEEKLNEALDAAIDETLTGL